MFFFFSLYFLAIERTIRSFSGVWVAVIALAGAALILMHQGYGVYIVQLGVYYTLLRWLLSGRKGPVLKSASAALLGIAGGVLLCSAFLWPLLAEKQFVYYPDELPLLIPRVPSLSLLTATLGWRTLWSPGAASYIGVSMAAFAIYGGVTAWKRGAGGDGVVAGRTVAILALFALLCAGSGSRMVNLSLPFLAILSGYITRVGRRVSPDKVLLAALVILLIDLGPTTVQSPFRSDRLFIREGMQSAAAAITPHRALFGYSSAAGTHYFQWGYNEQTGLFLPTGYFPQGAPRSLNGITAMVDGLNAPNGVLMPSQLDLLYLWDVSALMVYDRTGFRVPDLSGLAIDGDDPPLGRTEYASPLLYSRCVSIAKDDSLKALDAEQYVVGFEAKDDERQIYLRRMKHWVERMDIDRQSNRAAMLFLPDSEAKYLEAEPNVECPDSVAPIEPLVVTGYSAGLTRASVSYSAGHDGFLRLAFSWYPTLKVLLDGKEVRKARSLFGGIVLRTPKGDHTLQLVPTRPRHTPPILLGTAAGLALCLLGWMLAVRRPRPRGSRTQVR
jgi:hypothetical protein